MIGKVIREYRKSKKIRLRQLAGEIGISIATLSRIERGQGYDIQSYMKIQNWFTSADE